MKKYILNKIVSGGQTGADQAGLDAAISLGILHGGWVPLGRLTEAGPLPDLYHMHEMPDRSYAKRTEKNIIDSDGTLIVSLGELSGGSKLTEDLACKHSRPCLHADLEKKEYWQWSDLIVEWLYLNNIKTLNVAGPRASSAPDIYSLTFKLLESILK